MCDFTHHLRSQLHMRETCEKANKLASCPGLPGCRGSFEASNIKYFLMYRYFGLAGVQHTLLVSVPACYLGRFGEYVLRPGQMFQALPTYPLAAFSGDY